MSSVKNVVCLGRHGDLLNCIPIAYLLHKKGFKVNWFAGKEYASTLDGCSYINTFEWKGSQDTLLSAINHVRRYGNLVVPQAWKNRDQRHLTESFSKEQWRLAGFLGEHGKWPLMIDERSLTRETILREKIGFHKLVRPIILVCTSGVSGPFKYADKLIATIRGLNATIIDLDNVRAERFYDLLGLLDIADLLVTIDTAILHLARAAYCPMICLLRDGWEGPIPPPTSIASWRYSEVLNDLTPVLDAARKVIESKSTSFVIVANVFGQTERHLRARSNWPKNVIAKEHWGRDAKTELNNDRSLPFLKDLLQAGLDSGADTVIWTNDDISFLEDAFDKIQKHCAVFGFGCVRRDPTHCGREAFFFSRTWLSQHLSEMPDVIVGTERFDLVLARWLRKFRGIVTTEENLIYDFPPVELKPGLINHENHESWWTSEEGIKSPATRHNFALWNAG